MEWLLGVVVVLVLLWLFGRDSGSAGSSPAPPVDSAGVAGAAGAGHPAPGHGVGRARHLAAGAAAVPLAAAVLRRAAAPNDPDGAFMDGYVSGRFVERHASREPDRAHADDRRDPYSDDEVSSDDEDFAPYSGVHGGQGPDLAHGGAYDQFEEDDDW